MFFFFIPTPKKYNNEKVTLSFCRFSLYTTDVRFEFAKFISYTPRVFLPFFNFFPLIFAFDTVFFITVFLSSQPPKITKHSLFDRKSELPSFERILAWFRIFTWLGKRRTWSENIFLRRRTNRKRWEFSTSNSVAAFEWLKYVELCHKINYTLFTCTTVLCRYSISSLTKHSFQDIWFELIL